MRQIKPYSLIEVLTVLAILTFAGSSVFVFFNKQNRHWHDEIRYHVGSPELFLLHRNLTAAANAAPGPFELRDGAVFRGGQPVARIENDVLYCQKGDQVRTQRIPARSRGELSLERDGKLLVLTVSAGNGRQFRFVGATKEVNP